MFSHPSVADLVTELLHVTFIKTNLKNNQQFALQFDTVKRALCVKYSQLRNYLDSDAYLQFASIHHDK